jgi:hypothetical protein
MLTHKDCSETPLCLVRSPVSEQQIFGARSAKKKQIASKGLQPESKKTMPPGTNTWFGASGAGSEWPTTLSVTLGRDRQGARTA